MRISCKNIDLDIKAPPSKSVCHRELIVNFILGARGKYLEESPDDNDDIRATKSCLRALENEDSETVVLNCNESGSTLRFMIPVALAVKSSNVKTLIFRTRGRLIERPIKELAECLEPFGVKITKDVEANEIIVTGNIKPGKYVIDGSVSSQYISGLLMALSAFDGESSVEVTGGIASVHYIELTMAALSKYGINTVRDGDTFNVPAKPAGLVSDGNFEVEGDWSNGAFLLCLGSLINGGSVKVSGLNMDSVQGDMEIMRFLRLAGVSFLVEGDTVFVQDSHINPVREILEIDCGDIPDIVPYMAVVGAFRAKKTVLKGIRRLRIKESDRAEAITEMLSAIGGNVTLEEDTITIEYIERKVIPEKIVLTSSGDHRMAMSAVLCSAATGREIELDDINCLDKSFPEFRKVLLKEMTV
ncbi:MAG: 3-phosphoshikimate 1-carboxyvinyltransferase [Clostridiales bacterium]|nr:3-phosphoshikimate 1-carboxyvinyltransferase [Clostridiales bacterium]MBR3247646.1 3-phosphoshikimate 1-carboxyvinyltransferase [Clostridiales bacterium]